MNVRTLSRRQILVGASGFGLGLPILQSILPRELRAQGLPAERRFVAFATDHGGIDESAMYPPDSIFDTQEPLYSGHEIQKGTLSAQVADGVATISEILRGPADRLTDALIAKMNVLRGLDIPWYIAHHTGGHLGNFARNDANGDQGGIAQDSAMPTIDQIMAWSTNFYGDLAGITERSLVFGSNRLSYNWSSPSDRTGEIQEVSGSSDPATMFNRVFIPEEDPNEPAPRPAIVDRVFTSFQSLRQSDRRLSTEDKQRLDDHMDRVSELQRRLGTGTVRRSTCGDAIEPMGSGSTPQERYSLINDVIATAFLCGTSRIAIVKVNESSFVEYSGDWHQDVAHQHMDPEPQALLREVNQKAFEHAILDLAHKLDVEEAPGETILDSALLQWTQESGELTHDNRSAPVVTFGGIRGALNTGLCCDYRKRTDEGFAHDEWGGSLGYSGLLHTQWLATTMQLMGLDRAEFQSIEHNGPHGYGYPYIGDHYLEVQSDGVEANASDILPFLGA
jgi:hypothetical protein